MQGMFARYLLAIALFSASLATGQDLHSKLQKAFEFQCKQKLFMGAVAIKQKGATVFEAACGFANAEWQVPNAIDTEFRIGSITKQFTAVAILLLHQDGKLELTDTIGTWVPDLPQSWRSATLHQLLTHTSGIPNCTAAVNSAELKRLNRLGATPRELIDLANRTPLMFPPRIEGFIQQHGVHPLGNGNRESCRHAL